MPQDGAAHRTATATELSPARRRLRRFRVPVLVFALLAILAATRGLNVLAADHWFLALITGLATVVAALVGYRRLSRTVEARETVPELAATGRRSALARGGLLGFALFTTMILIIGLLGGWSRIGWGSVGGFLASVGAVASLAALLLCLTAAFVLLRQAAHTGRLRPRPQGGPS